MVRLIDPEVDPNQIWQDSTRDDDGDEAKTGGDSQTPPVTPGILDQSRWALNKGMLRQAYELLVEMGPQGLSQQTLGIKMGKTFFLFFQINNPLIIP